MYFNSKKTSLIILSVTALACSRTMFFFFDDPEGPNLLIVTVVAAVIYVSSLAAYLCNFSVPKKLVLAIFIQIFLVIGFYCCLS